MNLHQKAQALAARLRARRRSGDTEPIKPMHHARMRLGVRIEKGEG